MSNPGLNNQLVEKYRHDLEIIRNTAKQIIKDFELFGMEISFIGNEQTAYEEMKKQIVPALTELYKNETSKFNALLYRIDVSEKKIKEAVKIFSGKQLEEELANLVIEREFIKVLTRKFFS